MNFNPLELMKNAQEIQKRMADMQNRLGDMRIRGSSGGGMVEVEVNGRLETLAVRISPEAVVPAEDGAGPDLPLLGDLVLMAIRDAHAKAKETIERELGGPAGLSGLAGLSGVPGFPGSA